MTSKAVISQLEVNERRLKGIYDQLEGGNLKKAIFEADKVLKKNSNLLPAKVLKGLALYRLGKSIESYMLIDEVAKLTPTDENTLNSLSYFYKESNQKNKIIDIYEEAYKKCPNREDICANLFYCHTKNFDFLSQQKVATQLKKINVNHLEYVMWPIISNVLHGVYNKDERLIKLGEAILVRYLKSNSILTVEIIEFFMYTLEKSNKYSECLDWLNSSLLKDVIQNDQHKQRFNQYKTSILLKLDQKLEACDLFWEHLNISRLDVCTWRDYIDVVIELDMQPPEHPHSIASVIAKLRSDEAQATSMAVHVASIHMSTRLPALHPLSDPSDKVTRLVAYFRAYGDKPSCLFDVYSFLGSDSFSSSDRIQVLQQIIDMTGPLSISNLNDTKDVERYVSIETLKRALDWPDQIDLTQLVDEFYEHSLRLVTRVAAQYLPSEIKPCDGFIRLAAARYYDSWLKLSNHGKECHSDLEQAIIVLGRGIEQSPANYHLQLAMAHLVGQLGCAELLVDQFNKLDVKQLMWDSIGHVFILPLLAMPSFQLRVQFFKRNIDRKLKNQIEIEDSLVTCYKLGNYSRIPEIIELHRDIGASVMTRLSEMEILYITTVLKSNSCDDLFDCFSAINCREVESVDPELDILAEYSGLKDFRDLNTSPDFNQYDKSWIEQHRNTSFDNLLLWIAQRVLIIRSFYFAAKVTMETVVKLDEMLSDGSQCMKTEPSGHYRVLVGVRRQLDDAWRRIDALTGTYRPLNDCLTGCVEPPQRLFSSGYHDTIGACIDCFIEFYDSFVWHPCVANSDGDVNGVTGRSMPRDWMRSVVGPLQTLAAHVESMVIAAEPSEQTKPVGALSIMPDLLGKLTLACELFSWVTLTMALVENMSRPLKPKIETKKRMKKKKVVEQCDGVTGTTNEPPRLSEQFRSFLEGSKLRLLPQSLVDTAQQLESAIARVKLLPWFHKPQVGLGGMTPGWRTALDDANAFISVKKRQLNDIRKSFEDDLVSVGDMMIGTTVPVQLG